MKGKSNIQQYRGQWFIPGHEDIKLPGILEIDPETSFMQLRLYSEVNFLGERIADTIHGMVNLSPEIILGDVENHNMKITLYSGTDKGENTILENYVDHTLFESTYIPTIVLFDKHFSSRDEIRFNHFTFEFTHLGHWIDAIWTFFKEDWQKEKLIVSCWKPADDILAIYPDCRLIIHRDFHNKGAMLKEANMVLKHLARFESDSPKTLDQYYRLGEKLQVFLFFAVQTPSDITDCHTWADNDTPVKIYLNGIKEQPEEEWMDINQLLLTPKHFTHGELMSYLHNWFQFYDEFQAAYDTFYNAVKPFWEKRRDLTMTNIGYTNGILNVAQAIETFFGRDKGIDHKKVAQDYRNETKDKFSTKGKVLFFLKQLKTAVEGFIDETDFEEFAEQLKDCRNTLSHINHINSRDIHYNFKLSQLFYHSQILFVAMTFNKMGVEHGKINQALKRSRKFAYYRKRPIPS